VRSFDALIIGGGAAGLWCAITAGRRGRRVAVLDHAARLGRKILISGGGRCNFTNLHAGPANYLSANPHFCTSALARYRPEDFLREVESHGIAYHEKKLGQLFCDGSAKQIVDLLVGECAAAGVEIQTSCRVDGVVRQDAFVVSTSAGDFSAARLVIATGGLSVPPTGASDLGYRIARQFGAAVVETAPALVPLTLPAAAGLAELSGLSADSVVTAGGQSFRENILITHRGLSGPAILQASSYWRPGEALEIDLLPEQDDAGLFTRARAAGAGTLSSVLAERLPKRLAQWWLAGHGGDRPLQALSAHALTAAAEELRRWRVVPAGSEGYRTAEVTRGGVDTRGLSSKDLEARAQPGLHFIGEVVDVTGWLGGFNFQWAWASGHAAGQAL
jgi:predicted Rossmann fold flavoprotein